MGIEGAPTSNYFTRRTTERGTRAVRCRLGFPNLEPITLLARNTRQSKYSTGEKNSYQCHPPMSDKPNSKSKHLFAVLRIDLPVDQDNPENCIAVVKVFHSKLAAEHEVLRLNNLNSEKGCRYFLNITRLAPLSTEGWWPTFCPLLA